MMVSKGDIFTKDTKPAICENNIETETRRFDTPKDEPIPTVESIKVELSKQVVIDTQRAKEIQSFVDEKNKELQTRLNDLTRFEELATRNPDIFPPEAIALLKQARNVGYGSKFKAIHKELHIFFA
jgi:hypothetical protein